jgi:hypothetical protein
VAILCVLVVQFIDDTPKLIVIITNRALGPTKFSV